MYILAFQVLQMGLQTTILCPSNNGISSMAILGPAEPLPLASWGRVLFLVGPDYF
jgi:hypothetical protein